jgi:hypothetical protein
MSASDVLPYEEVASARKNHNPGPKHAVENGGLGKVRALHLTKFDPPSLCTSPSSVPFSFRQNQTPHNTVNMENERGELVDLYDPPRKAQDQKERDGSKKRQGLT